MSKLRSPRILHIASGDLWAGAEVQLFTLVKTLHGQLNVPVSVVLLNHGTLEHKLRDAGIPIFVLDEARLNGFRILLGLIRVIRERKPDLIHTHRHKENILGSFAALAAGNIPSLRTVHGVRKRPPFLHLARRFIHFINWATGRFLQSRIISVSDDLATILAEEFPRSKIRVIENGVDPDDEYRQADEPEIRQHDDMFRIGMVGRLVPVKRVDIFIDAARYVLKQDPDTGIRFYIVGDGPLREALESLSRESGTDKIVHFLGHQDDVLRQIQDLDALMMTSDHEGLPMVLLEAMALKVPVIAHRIGGIPNLLDQGACGILVDGQDPEDYAQAILELKENPKLQKDIADKARVRVSAEYSAKKNAQASLAMYISLMSHVP